MQSQNPLQGKKEKKEESDEQRINRQISQAINTGKMTLLDELMVELNRTFPFQGSYKEDSKKNIEKTQKILQANLGRAIKKFQSAVDFTSADTALIMVEKLRVRYDNLCFFHPTLVDSTNLSASFLLGRELFSIMANEINSDDALNEVALKINKLVLAAEYGIDDKIKVFRQCLAIALNEYNNPSKSPKQQYYLYVKIDCLAKSIKQLAPESELMGIPSQPAKYTEEAPVPPLKPLQEIKQGAEINENYFSKEAGTTQSRSTTQKGSTPAKDVKESSKYGLFSFFNGSQRTVLLPTPFDDCLKTKQIPNEQWAKAMRKMQKQVSTGSTNFRSEYSTLLAGIKLRKAPQPSVEFYNAHIKYVNSLLSQALKNFEHILDNDPKSIEKKTRLYQTVFNLVQCLIEIDQGHKQFLNKDKTDELFPEALIKRLGFYYPQMKESQRCPMMKFCTLCYYKHQYEKLIVPLQAQGHRIFKTQVNKDFYTYTYKGEVLSEKTTIEQQFTNYKLEEMMAAQLVSQPYATPATQQTAIMAYNQNLQEKARLLHLPATVKGVIRELDKAKTHTCTGKLEADTVFSILEGYLETNEGEDKITPSPKGNR